jgi:hypothetical protein
MKIDKLVEKEGMDNLLFIVPLLPVQDLGFVKITSSSDDHVNVPCHISEERYKVSEGYKITMVSDIPEYGYEHFYQMDLESLIKRGIVKVYRRVK